MEFCFLSILGRFAVLGWIRSDFFGAERNSNFTSSTFLELSLFLRKCVLDIGVWMRNGGVWRHMGAYGCVTDAYECIRMHTDAYGCIWMHTRY